MGRSEALCDACLSVLTSLSSFSLISSTWSLVVPDSAVFVLGANSTLLSGQSANQTQMCMCVSVFQPPSWPLIVSAEPGCW